MSQERRIYPRAKMKWPVIVKTDEGSMDGVTSDVTPNGVFIHCQKPLRLNMVFEMAISIPNSEHSITAKAEVVWSNRWGPDDEISPRGMGVRFVKISSEARKFIARAAMNNLKSKEVAPELLQTLQTLVIEIDETKSQAA
ncbi:MAG: PilZ domain-containing protein [Deltaproteobacteria bacterium]|nr:PilZ domain-containing protein [Deltaproteobacteria bacterium]MDH3774187.1 PilZ domain-containing protein [Deltaproteobacteria bacterium]MDH3802343.1 PilZ domain-containing protein [Deltaproteobacteria bacterium]MDH3852281.1 PilZ domain-containing protein [Deltaproteobacteria bacterium]MDH3897621.1 PilZ domain-containing protein [Deltaproteobacteria bacterium]